MKPTTYAQCIHKTKWKQSVQNLYAYLALKNSYTYNILREVINYFNIRKGEKFRHY